MTRADEERAVGGRTSTFIDDFGFRFSGDDRSMRGEADITAGLRVAGGGQVRVAALATLADVMAGTLSSRIVQPRLSLTLDLGTDVVGDSSGDRLTMAASVLKAGRGTVVTEVEFHRPDSGALVALSQLTFVPSPRPVDVLPSGFQPGSSAGRFTEPWERRTGVRQLAAGSVEVDCSRYVTQLSGTLQGGMVALIAELAAESLVGAPVTGSQLRYLASVRRGPARATARLLGPDTVRVEVRDTGNDGRLAAVGMLRTAG